MIPRLYLIHSSLVACSMRCPYISFVFVVYLLCFYPCFLDLLLFVFSIFFLILHCIALFHKYFLKWTDQNTKQKNLNANIAWNVKSWRSITMRSQKKPIDYLENWQYEIWINFATLQYSWYNIFFAHSFLTSSCLERAYTSVLNLFGGTNYRQSTDQVLCLSLYKSFLILVWELVLVNKLEAYYYSLRVRQTYMKGSEVYMGEIRKCFTNTWFRGELRYSK